MVQRRDCRSQVLGLDHVPSGMDGSSHDALIDEWATIDIDE